LLNSALQQAIQHFREFLLRLQAEQSLQGAIVILEEEDLGDGGNPVAIRQIRIIEDVHLAYLDPTSVLSSDAIDDRR
jgi:hypothetical protein